MRERPLILTADDDRGFLGKLAVLLERLHCEVLPVVNGGDVLALARVMRPRAIMLNMQLAEPAALVLLRELRADAEIVDTPVVMTTTVREKRQVWEAMSLGCIEVLDKPIELAAVHQALQRCNLFPEARRRYLRASYSRPVEVKAGETVQVVNAMTLSERGIMVRMPHPLTRGTAVEIRLALPDEQVVVVGGVVIYVRDHPGAATAGVAISFDRLTIKGAENLHLLVKQLLIGDLVTGQGEEPVVKPG